MNWSSTIRPSCGRYGARYSLRRRRSMSVPLRAVLDAIEEDGRDLVGGQPVADAGTGVVRAEHERAKRGGGDVGGDGELVGVRREHVGEDGPQLVGRTLEHLAGVVPLGAGLLGG